jgi:hypothetical protein
MFAKAAAFYEKLCGSLFDGPDSLGLYILYDLAMTRQPSGLRA